MQDINFSSIYIKNDTVITKEIEDELVIVKMNDQISDVDSPIYTLNTTGKAIWEKIDGKRSLNEIIEQLQIEFIVPIEKLENDIKNLITILIDKHLIFE